MAQNSRDIAEQLDELFQDSGRHHGLFEPWIESAVRIGWPEHIPRLGGLYDRELIPAISRIISQVDFVAGEVPEESLRDLREKTLNPRELDAIVKSASDELKVLQAAYVAAALARGPYHEIVASKGRGGAHMVHHPMRRLILPDVETDRQIILSNGMEYLSRIILGGALLQPNPERRMAFYVDGLVRVRSYLQARAGMRRALEETSSFEDEARELSAVVARNAGMIARPWWIDSAISTTMAAASSVLVSFALAPFPVYIQLGGSGVGGAAGALAVPTRRLGKYFEHLSRFEKLGSKTKGRLTPGWVRTAEGNIP
ncbi:hypothetical protein ACFV4F_35965 [Kitasatospora sp. NPDC059722]|uniref:hypothetical protein n=1 Tax=unclassified Kitasatospora TaxID=2633591 RepID=UPI003654B6B6